MQGAVAASFLAGAVAASSIIGMLILHEKRKKSKLLADKGKNDSQRFQSLTRTLDLAVQMSENCVGCDRAMIAIAVGEDLYFQYFEPKLLRFLGFADSDPQPRTVYDLLPSSMAPHHRIWVASALRANRLPSRLQHPLRSVEVRRASGYFVQMDLKIDWVQGSEPPTFELVFAPCSQQLEIAPTVPNVRFGEQIEHEHAVVMLLDIVEFTKACSQLSAVEVCIRSPH
jgi:hypothetical protein